MNNVHFAIPEIYGDSLSYYEVLRELIIAMNEMIDNYDTIPEQIADAVKNLDVGQLFSDVLNQLIDSIATDNTKSANAVKMYNKHDLLYAEFNETVNLYESLIDFPTGTETELIVGSNIREVNISELFIELRELIDNEARAREQADNLKVNNTDILSLEQIKTAENLNGKVPSASALKNVNELFGNIKFVYQSNVPVNFSSSRKSDALNPPENAVAILSVNGGPTGYGWTYAFNNNQFKIICVDNIIFDQSFNMNIVWACSQ